MRNFFQKIIENKVIGTKEAIQINAEYLKFVKNLEDKTLGEKNKSNQNISEVFEQIIKDDTIKDLSGNELNNYINKKIEQCEKKLNDIKSKETKLCSSKQNKEFLALIDSSKNMEKNIDNFVQNILYETLLKLGFKLDEKIKLYYFNSSDSEERSKSIRKLKKETIQCEGEIKLYESLNKANELMSKYPENTYYLLILVSGDIKDKDELRILAFKMFGLNEKVDIIPRIIKFINNKSDFPDETKDEDITYGLIRQLDTRGLTKLSQVKPLVIKEEESNDDIIPKIVDLFTVN